MRAYTNEELKILKRGDRVVDLELAKKHYEQMQHELIRHYGKKALREEHGITFPLPIINPDDNEETTREKINMVFAATSLYSNILAYREFFKQREAERNFEPIH